MSTSSLEDQIQARVNAFVSELSSLVREAALTAVQEVLGGEAPRVPAKRGRTNKKAKRTSAAPKRKSAGGKRVRRTPEDLKNMAQEVITFVKSNQGSAAGAIAKGLGVATKDLKRPVDDLLAAKKLRKQGERRGTQYFVGAARGAAKARAKAKPRKKAAKRKKSTRRKAA